MNFHHFIDSATPKAREVFIRHVLEVGRDHADWKNTDDMILSNIDVFTVFLQFTRKLVATDRHHYSARTIIEAMRFSSDVADNDVTFKINNNLAPDFSRLAMLAFPNVLDGFFETRNGNRVVVRPLKEAA